MTTTVINNANWAIIWDRSAANHVCRRGAEFAYCELLLSGVTSLVDISPPWEGLDRPVRQKRIARVSEQVDAENSPHAGELVNAIQ